MATTLAQFETQLRGELFTDPNGKIWSDTLLDGYINQAYLQVQGDGQFGWPGIEKGSATISCTQGTQEYALPDDFGRVRLILNGSQQLYPTTFEQAKIQNPTGVQALPSNYYLDGFIIGFDPVPSTGLSISLWYQKHAPALSETVDSALTTDFDPAIVKYAAYLAWSAPRGNADTAKMKMVDYQGILARLMNTYLYRDNQGINFRVQRNAPNNNSRSNTLNF